MASFSIGDAVGSGFGLIRRQPLSVLVWGLALLVLQVIVVMNFVPMYSALLSTSLNNPGDSTALQSVMGEFAQRTAMGYLLNFVQIFVTAVINCAVFRAILRPEAPGVAYLRLGVAELLTFAFIIGVAIVAAVVILIFAVIVGILVAVLAGVHAGATAGVVGVVSVIAAVGILIYLALRLSLVGPTIVAENRLGLGESWNLTRGRAAPLLGVGLLLILILLACEIVVVAIFMAVGFSVLSLSFGGMQNLAGVLRTEGLSAFSRVMPLVTAVALVSAPLLGCATAIMTAPWARIYRDLKGPDLAATFS